MSADPNVTRARELAEQGRAADRAGDAARALGFYGDAASTFDTVDEKGYVAEVLRWEGTLYRERGETAAAYKCYARSLSAAERAGSLPGRAHALNCLATIAQRRGDMVETEKLYSGAALLAEQAGEQRLLGMIQQNRGVLASIAGDLDTAAARYASSLEAFEKTDDDEAVSWVLNNLGMLHTKRKDFAKASEVLERSLRIAEKRGDDLVKRIVELNRVEAWIGLGMLEQAEKGCALSLEQSSRRGDHLSAGEALKYRARIQRARGEFSQGIDTLGAAASEAKVAEDRLLQAEILRELGELHHESGDVSNARAAWTEAASGFDVAGASEDAVAMRTRLATAA
jgi:tetratricopeptide (TPR) repeat protein